MEKEKRKVNYTSRCITCKWRALGHYSKRYGGVPIGCKRPYDAGAGFGDSCKYGRREENQDV